MSSLLQVKLITLFSLLFSSAIASLAPFLINKISACIERRRGRPHAGPNKTILKILDVCQGFAGGVLLAGGLLHLVPDATDTIQDILAKYGEKAWFVTFPWALACSALSLYCLYTLETLFSRVFCSMKPPAKAKKMHVDEESKLLNADAAEEEEAESSGQIVARIITGIVLWISLSLHSFFAGLGLGAENDEAVR